MALNREQKRRLKKQGEIDDDGSPATRQRSRPTAPPPRTRDDRVGPRQFLHEVRQELRKVAWPTRSETVNYSIVVFATLVLMTVLIFALDWVFAKGVLALFDV